MVIEIGSYYLLLLFFGLIFRILQRWGFSASKVYTYVTIVYTHVAILGRDIYTIVTSKKNN